MAPSPTFPSLILRLTALCVVAVVCLATSGCGSHQKSLSRETSGIKKLALVYGRFLSQSRGQPPTSEAELRKYAQSLRPVDLKAFGVDDIEQIFLSDRDGKPYVVIYGKPQGPLGPGGSPVIAYEQEGKAGKRWVASVVGAVEEVDEARFQQLVPTAKK